MGMNQWNVKQSALRLGALTVLALLAACSNQTGTGTPGDGSGASDATADSGSGADTSPDTTVDSGSDTTADSGSGADTGADTSTDTGGEPSCTTAADCRPRHDCIEGVCVRICGVDTDCDDLTPCTTEVCTEGLCVFTPATPELADPLAGDCKKRACVAGRTEDVASPLDLPADDSIGCTLSQCVGEFPFQRPQDALCDDGDLLNGVERCDPNIGCVGGDVPRWICDEPPPGWESREVCDDGLDNDQNGRVDEGCDCDFGSIQRCYSGPPSTRGVGGCTDGLQACEDRANPQWGPCTNVFGPGTEICDAKDNDCDGCVDDLADCDASDLVCPTELLARPLADFTLSGDAIVPGWRDLPYIRWNWTVEGPPNSATSGPVNRTAANTSVFLDVSGDYFVTVEVELKPGEPSITCGFVVRAQGSGLRVEMRWDTFGSVDMDFHLHRSGTTTNFCTDDDCYYGNCRTYGAGLPWGYVSSPAEACGGGAGDTCYNPRLDIDNIVGFDPENINVDNPNNGDSFRVMSHMFGGTARTNPVVTIYCGGRLKAVFGEAPDLVGLTRAGGSCGGETWRVADVRMLVDPETGVTDCVVEPLLGRSGGYDVRQGDATF